MSSRSRAPRSKPRARAQLSRARKDVKAQTTFCVCHGPDDGRAMIHCSHCENWFHFSCVALADDEAEDMEIYVCPPCQEATSLQPVRKWEGLDALEEDEEVVAREVDHTEDFANDGTPTRPATPEESVDEGSGDEYVEGDLNSRRTKRIRRVSVSSSESDSPSTPVDGATITSSSRRRRSSSPRPHKRKSTASAPSAKRKKSSSEPSSAAKDAARKFCLGKLEELFVPIFTQYPYLSVDGEDQPVLREVNSLSDEDKQTVEQNAKKYAHDVEAAMFDSYAEADKGGKPTVAGRYKERFRMLTFNLGQSDRVLIHTRIASGSLPPSSLAQLDSTSLANETTQAEIAAAAAESLAQTILVRSLAAPRAKLTHKGMVELDTDDLPPDAIASQAREDREQAAEVQREAERLARTRPMRKTSMSVPPESPVTPQSEQLGWGAPPPVPQHALDGPSVHSFFSPSSLNQPVGMGADMTIDDLIHFDDHVQIDGQQFSVPASPVDAVEGSLIHPSTFFESDPRVGTPFDLGSTLPLAVPNFDLSTLWGGQNSPDVVSGDVGINHLPAANAGADGQTDMDLDGDEDDEAFDMFLRDEEGLPTAPQSIQVEEPKPMEPPAPLTVEEKPCVWTGTFSMPLDTDVPQATPVCARQIAGRAFGASSSVWQTLMPGPQLRIDGRVQTEKSSQFLLQMRMSSAKELLAVAFSPDSEDSKFKALFDYLVAKERHGLVFPWGTRTKESSPGKELYIMPLAAREPIPECIDVLEDLELPKARTNDYLIGVYVLTKGKLIESRAPSAQVPPVYLAQVPMHPEPSVPSAPPLPPALPVPPVLPTANVPTSGAAVPQFSAASLAELAKVPQERLQALLASLSPMPPPPANSQPGPVQPIVPLPPGPSSQPRPFSQPPFLPPHAHGLVPPMPPASVPLPYGGTPALGWPSAPPFLPAPPPPHGLSQSPPPHLPFGGPSPLPGPMPGWLPSPGQPGQPMAGAPFSPSGHQGIGRGYPPPPGPHSGSLVPHAGPPGPHGGPLGPPQYGDGHFRNNSQDQNWGPRDSWHGGGGDPRDRGRGRGGGRGRGRGRGDDRDGDRFRSSVDSGWNRKGRR